MNPGLVVLAALVSQPTPRQQIDPALPESVAPVVARAIEAELDPKRGAPNAKAIIAAEFPKHRQGSPSELALRLRHAAIEMRRHFMQDTTQPEPIRWEQAIATFARLDLRDPGLAEWLERSLEHHAYARKKLGKKKLRRLEATVLVRGDVDQKVFVSKLRKQLRAIGYDLAIVPAKKASLILKLGAVSAPSPSEDRRAVRVELGMESVRNGKTIWRHRLHRTESAKDFDVAYASALDWLVSIGGRDLFFRWLGERAFHSLLDRGVFGVAQGHDHEREDEGHGKQHLFGNPPVPGRH